MPWFPTSFVDYDVRCFSLKVDLTTWYEVIRFVGLGCCSCFWVSSFHLCLGVFLCCVILSGASSLNQCFFLGAIALLLCRWVDGFFWCNHNEIVSLLSQSFFLCDQVGGICVPSSYNYTCFIVESILFFCAIRLLLYVFHQAITIVVSSLSWSFFLCVIKLVMLVFH